MQANRPDKNPGGFKNYVIPNYSGGISIHPGGSGSDDTGMFLIILHCRPPESDAVSVTGFCGGCVEINFAVVVARGMVADAGLPSVNAHCRAAAEPV